MHSVRLIRGAAGWWVLSAKGRAHVPPDAVHDGVLTEPAVAHLSANDFFVSTEDRPYGLTILAAASCNLGCAYCFQNTAPAPAATPFTPRRIAAGTMTPQTIAAVAAFVGRQIEATGRKGVYVQLMGGEPLLHVDGCVDLLTSLQPYRLVGSNLLTNGTLLTVATAEKLHATGLTAVQITFDGDESTHDTIRVDHAGRGTYRTIMSNILAVSAALSFAWCFRVNISHHNAATVERLIDDLADLGLSDVQLELALVKDTGVGYLNELDLDGDFRDIYVAMIDRACAAGFRVKLQGNHGFCAYCSETGGTAGAVVSTDGLLYSCAATAGRPELAVGDVESGYRPVEACSSSWMSCATSHSSHLGAEAADVRARSQRFYDFVDAHILDRSYLSRR